MIRILYSLFIINCSLTSFAFALGADGDTLCLTLEECIDRARSQSLDAAVALSTLRSAYWQYRYHRADLLPEVSLSATLPALNKRYNVYQRDDGTYSYVHNDNFETSTSIFISQRLPLTGGTLSLQSSLDYMHQLGDTRGNNRNQLMSIPVALTYTQPLFGLNSMKWDCRIEPLRYREALANYLTQTEHVAMTAISRYFDLVIAIEQVNIARQNLQTAEKLYEVAQARREMGDMSKNDVLQMHLSLLQARSSLTSAQTSEQTCRFALCNFLGIEGDVTTICPDSVPRLTLAFDEVLHHALQSNAFATTMRRRQLEAEYEVASARANRYSVSLYAQIGFTGSGSTLHDTYNRLSANEVVKVGVSVPLVDWGKRRGRLKMAENNREIVENQLRRQSQEFNQDLFVLTQRFNNQLSQLDIAVQADSIAQVRYATNVETFKIGTLSTLELSDAQTAKDQARLGRISQLYQYWYLYYQIRSITLWDFEKGETIPFHSAKHY